MVHGIRADESNRQILSKSIVDPYRSYSWTINDTDVLQKRPSSPTLKTHTISYLKERTNSFEYTLSVLRTLEKQTRDEIQRLGGNVKLEGIVDTLHIDSTWGNANGLKDGQLCNLCNISLSQDVVLIKKTLESLIIQSLKNISRFARGTTDYRLITSDAFLDFLRNAAKETQLLEEIGLLLQGVNVIFILWKDCEDGLGGQRR